MRKIFCFKRYKITIMIIMVNLLSIIGCKTDKPLQTVSSVDLAKYTGTWYEIAAFPQPFEKGLSCVKAEYSTSGKKYITVLNSGYKEAEKKFVTAKGKAFVVKGSDNSKLMVQFFWPFKGKYWIIELAPDYSYAVIGHPNRKYLWILARTKELDASLYKKILTRTNDKGFDITKLKKTDQSCNQ
jgi:apolipoprotein D and lipocalin family protein